MRTFNEWALQEGFFSNSVMNWVNKQLGPIKQEIDKAIQQAKSEGLDTVGQMAAVLEVLKKKHKGVADALLKVSKGKGDSKASVAEHVAKLSEALQPCLDIIEEEGFEEGMANPEAAAKMAEIGQMMSFGLKLGLSGLAFAVALYLAFVFRDRLINVLGYIAQAAVAGAGAVKDKISPPESKELQKYRRDRMKRDQSMKNRRKRR